MTLTVFYIYIYTVAQDREAAICKLTYISLLHSLLCYVADQVTVTLFNSFAGIATC